MGTVASRTSHLIPRTRQSRLAEEAGRSENSLHGVGQFSARLSGWAVRASWAASHLWGLTAVSLPA